MKRSGDIIKRENEWMIKEETHREKCREKGLNVCVCVCERERERERVYDYKES